MTENTQPEKKDDKTIMFASVAILAILLLAGGYYWYFVIPQQNQIEPVDELSEFEKKVSNDPSAKEMFAAFDRQKNFSGNYHATYLETLQDGTTQQIEIYKTDEMKFAKITNDIFEQQAYWIGKEIYVCQSDFERNKQCAKVTDGAGLNIAKNIETLFIGYDPFARSDNEKLFRLGVLKFVGVPEQKTVAGKTCTQVEYTLDYSNLTEFQLTSLGIPPTDPMLTVFGNFSMTRCFETQSGLTIQRQMDYVFLYQNTSQTHKVDYLKFETPAQEKIELAQTNTDAAGLEKTIEKMDSFAQYIDDCVSSEGSLSKCILMNAVQEEDVTICALISDKVERDRCSLRIVSLTNTPQLCEKTGDLKDECYLNYAYVNNDKSYCTIITDSTKKEECLLAVEGKKTGAVEENK